MRDPEFLVRFRPSGREVYVLRGTRVAEAAAEAGLVLESPCGGEGLCGRCRLRVASGSATPTSSERHWLSQEELADGWRLACQSVVEVPMEIEFLTATSPAAEYQILTHSHAMADTAELEPEEPANISRHGRPGGSSPSFPGFCFNDPLVGKRFVELLPPARGDDCADVVRLERVLEIERLEIGLPLLRELPARMRQAGFCGTAVVAADKDVLRLLDFESGNTAAETFGVAFDIGTTTLVATLLDLATGSERAVASRLNPQTRYGDDVLSRILHARNNSAAARQLSEAIAVVLDEMIGALCEKGEIDRRQIYEATFAGNTTMQQLLCGVDTRALGEVPFVAATAHALVFPAAELGLHIHPNANGYVMPVIGGFVGGDTVAGILATGMADGGGPTLLIDIGTNGEIVLQADGKLTAASTAAGPAFEGARISCGMRGCTGAIEKVVVDGRLRTNVIGNVAPLGLCGSGLIDAAAELLRHRILNSHGRLQTPDELPANTLPDLARRVILQEGRVAFLLATADEAEGKPLVLTQRDFRELQLATGAIRAGVVILLRQAGLQPKDLQRVLIGGGFGNFIRRNNAQRIGLLPTEIERRRIRYMGNTALAGARLVALSRQARQLAEELARRTTHVDLSADRDFHNVFADSMLFPEGEE